MSDYTVKKIEDMESLAGGAFVKARASLGVTAFGMAIEEHRPNSDRYPEHNHAHDGKEEVYVILSGSAEMQIDDTRIPLDTNTLMRVGPETTRKLWPGDEGCRVLVIGGAPGKVYEPPAFTELESATSST